MTPEMIKQTLAKLDIGNDDHWTSDGMARVDVLKTLSGDATLTRDAVTAAAPGFSRAVAAEQASQGGNDGKPEASNAPSAAPPVVLRTDGPTLAEFVAAGYKAENYPPMGYASREGTSVVIADVDPANAVAQAERVLAQAQVEQETANRMLVVAKSNKAQADKDMDAAAHALAKVKPVETTSDAIQGYLASQRKVLEARAQQNEGVKAAANAAGLTVPAYLAALMPGGRAKIDMAMARRTARGGNRPTKV